VENDLAALYRKIDNLTAIARGFQGAVVLSTAASLELFTLLDKEPLGADEVASSLGLDPRATEIFLHALAGMGLLETGSGRFSNSELASELLVRGRPYFQGDIIAHSGNLISRWVQLPRVLETGRPAEGPRSVDDKTLWRNFILGMSNTAGLSAQKVARNIDLGNYRRMLDLGGGPGTYAVHFCRINPNLSAVVLDLPEVIDEITSGQVKEAQLDKRISFIKGDYLKVDFGSGYDLVFISNIIHSLSGEGNRLLLRRSFSALEHGGRIIVKDFLLDEDRINPPHSSMFAVNMLVGTSSGGCYTASEVKSWLDDAGFSYERQVDLTPQARMIIAVKP